MEAIEINENEHFTVDRNADLYVCNFCSKVIKNPMAARLNSFFSIWYHLKHMHPKKIKKTMIQTYLN